MSADPAVLRETVREAAEAFRAHHAAEVARREAVAAVEVARAEKERCARDLANLLELLPSRSLAIVVVGEGETVEGWEISTGGPVCVGAKNPSFVEFYPKPFAVVR